MAIKLVKEPPGSDSFGEAPYAGLVTRAVGFIVDAAIVSAITVAVVGSTSLVLSMFGRSLSDLPNTFTIIVGTAAAVGLNAVYFVGAWRLTGQTPGMRVVGITVVGKGGERLSIWKGALRLFGMVIAAIPLFAGYLLILVDDRRRGLHDRFAGSVVLFRRQGLTTGQPPRGARSSVRLRSENSSSRPA